MGRVLRSKKYEAWLGLGDYLIRIYPPLSEGTHTLFLASPHLLPFSGFEMPPALRHFRAIGLGLKRENGLKR
jgi:hypothetical protein